VEPIRLAIVGCGGTGRRHLAGLAELAWCGVHVVDLVAVCDLNERNAQDLAEEAHALLGRRPAVFPELPTMARDTDGLEAYGLLA
jgi:predicted dehydrogenase